MHKNRGYLRNQKYLKEKKAREKAEHQHGFPGIYYDEDKKPGCDRERQGNEEVCEKDGFKESETHARPSVEGQRIPQVLQRGQYALVGNKGGQRT